MVSWMLVNFQCLDAVTTYSLTPGLPLFSGCLGFGFTLLAAAFVKETHIDAICHAENDESGSMRMEKALQAAPPSGSVVFGICETL